MHFDKEYFLNPYYFFMKERKNHIDLYYSINNILTEARKNDEIIKFKKENKKEFEKLIKDLIKDKKPKTQSELKKKFDSKKEELGELVDSDGTFLSSRIPLGLSLSPKYTTDVYVTMSRQTNNPLTRGYRVYWGESEEKSEDVVSEVNFDPAFGYDETKNMNGKKTYKFLKDKMDLNPKDAYERTVDFGKDPTGKRTKRAPKKIRRMKGFIDRMNLFEKDKIEEIRKERAIKMVEDILLNNKNTDNEIYSDNQIEKIIEKLKLKAKKEGISFKELVKKLKYE